MNGQRARELRRKFGVKHVRLARLHRATSHGKIRKPGRMRMLTKESAEALTHDGYRRRRARRILRERRAKAKG